MAENTITTKFGISQKVYTKENLLFFATALDTNPLRPIIITNINVTTGNITYKAGSGANGTLYEVWYSADKLVSREDAKQYILKLLTGFIQKTAEFDDF